MKLVFVNIMQELQRFDSTAYITQPPVSLALLNAATPKVIDTALLDEQAEAIEFDGDVFAFSVSTQNARAVYEHADALRSAGKKASGGPTELDRKPGALSEALLGSSYYAALCRGCTSK